MNKASQPLRTWPARTLGIVFCVAALAACKKKKPPPPPPQPVAVPVAAPAPRMEFITISDRIQFETGNAVLLPASLPILNQVVKVMRDHPHILLVQVEGHTDSVGDEKENLLLSQARAESVRAYLLSQGITVDRLKAMGFGERIPVVGNETEVGRLQNRRVEFRVIKHAP